MDIVEYGPSGPTAVKDITPLEGMSDSAASFISANASPFTNPRDMPCPAKVPDPRNTMDTDTMFIWGHIEVPTHALTSGIGCTIVSNPDPLAPIPLWWSQNSVTDSSQAVCSPNIWAQTYNSYGMHEVVAQCDMLARRSRSYRIVGHGLKAWVSRSATLSTGTVSGYQVDLASAQTFHNTNNALYPQAKSWTNFPDSDAGFQASLIASISSTAIAPALNSAKNEEYGFLAAEEGCTVRWTDTSDFSFKPTRNYNVVHPLRKTTSLCAVDDYLQVVNTNINGTLPANRIFAMPPTLTDLSQTNIAINFQSDRLCSYYSSDSANNLPQVSLNTGGAAAVVGPPAIPAVPPTPSYYLSPSNTARDSYQSTNVAYSKYATSAKEQFDTALAIEVAGVSSGSTVIVQVCWHVEYVPLGNEPWSSSSPSPVDLQYDVYASLLRDRRAFPIVVKGHSFFSNLRKAFAKVGKAAGKIFGYAGAAGGAMMAIPGLQGVGGILGTIGAAGTAAVGGVSMIDSAIEDIIAGGRASKRILMS